MSSLSEQQVLGVRHWTDTLFSFKTTREAAFRYQSGQFVMMGLERDGRLCQIGFLGGLVPGVEVYAYMTRLPVERWGRAWLEHGTAECRLLKPVYDGDALWVTASETPEGLAKL